MDSDDFRRAREYAAWILVAAAAVQVFLGGWTLSGLPEGPTAVFHSGSIFGPGIGPPFWLRAEGAFPYLVPSPSPRCPSPRCSSPPCPGERPLRPGGSR